MTNQTVTSKLIKNHKFSKNTPPLFYINFYLDFLSLRRRFVHILCNLLMYSIKRFSLLPISFIFLYFLSHRPHRMMSTCYQFVNSLFYFIQRLFNTFSHCVRHYCIVRILSLQFLLLLEKNYRYW